MANDWVSPGDVGAWIATVEKRLSRVERRPVSGIQSVISGDGEPARVYDDTGRRVVSVAAPTVSPLFRVVGNATGLLVITEPVLGTTMLDYFINGVRVEKDLRATVVALHVDGSGAPLVANVDYSVQVQAQNDNGAAPISAAVIARLDEAVSVEYVVEILQAGFIVAGALQIGTFMTLDSGGITIVQLDGTVTHLAADGSGNQFSGQGTFTAIDVLDKFNIFGQAMLRGNMAMANGFGNPTQQTNVTDSWNVVVWPTTGVNRRGLTDNALGTQWVIAENLGASSNIQMRTAAGLVTSFPVLAGWLALGGVTRVGNIYYVLAAQASAGKWITDNWRVLRYDATSFGYLGSWSANDGATMGTGAAYPGIGKTATGLVIGFASAGGNLYAKEFSLDGINTGATLLSTTWGGSSHVMGIEKSAVGFAATRFAVASNFGIQTYSTAGVRQWGEDWTPGASDVRGLMVTQAGRWQSLHADRVVNYTLNVGTWDFKHTWTDSVGPSYAETLPSPVRTVTPKRFAQWVVSLPTPPPGQGGVDDANTANLYAAPTGSAVGFQVALPIGVNSYTFDAMVTGGAAAPVVSGFESRPAARRGHFYSEALGNGNPLIDFYGNGDYRLDGRDLSGTGGWVPLDSNVTGWGIKYSVRNGRVTVIVDGAFTTGGSIAHSLGSGALPSQYWPPTNARSGGYFAGRAGVITVSPTGLVSAIQMTGTSLGSVSGVVSYPTIA